MYWTTFKKSDLNIWINHSASVAVDDLIYSFNSVSGGNEPIDIYVLNTHTLQCSLLPHPIGINGERLKPPDVPKKREGHTVVAYDKKIYLWGGEKACNTLYCFDTKTLNWSRPKVSGIIPSSRIFHSACTFNHLMYVFGGFDSYPYRSNLDVLCLDLKTMNWSYIKTTGRTPSRRRYRATIINDRMYIFEAVGYIGDSIMYLDLKSNCWHRQETTGENPYIKVTTSLAVHNSRIYAIGRFDDLYYFDTKRNHWNLARDRGNSPRRIENQSFVVIGDKIFILGYREEDTYEYRNVIHVLDFNPSLQTLAVMEIIENGLDFSCLPTKLRSQIHDFKLGNI